MSAAVQPFPYFGRAWNISVTPQGGGPQVTLASNGSTPTLRCLFEISTVMLTVAWQAELKIYNLNAATRNSIIAGSALSIAPPTPGFLQPNELLLLDALTMGDNVTIAAGYLNNGSGGNFNPVANLLYAGNVLQAFATRERVVDTRLTIRCVANLALYSFGYVNKTLASGLTDFDALQMLAYHGGIPIDFIDADSQKILTNTKYPKSQNFTGRPDKLIDMTCSQRQLISWIGPKGLNVRSFGANLTPEFLYAPPSLANPSKGAEPTAVLKPTIIDTPQQTQAGLIVRVLMDSQVRIGSVVQIARGTSINNFQFPYGTLPPLPDAKGIYVVAGIRHSGDTRGSGNDWYSELTCLTPQFNALASKLGKPLGATS